MRALVTVAEVTISIRGIAAEFGFDHEEAGLDRPSAINATDFTPSPGRR